MLQLLYFKPKKQSKKDCFLGLPLNYFTTKTLNIERLTLLL